MVEDCFRHTSSADHPNDDPRCEQEDGQSQPGYIGHPRCQCKTGRVGISSSYRLTTPVCCVPRTARRRGCLRIASARVGACLRCGQGCGARRYGAAFCPASTTQITDYAPGSTPFRSDHGWRRTPCSVRSDSGYPRRRSRLPMQALGHYRLAISDRRTEPARGLAHPHLGMLLRSSPRALGSGDR